MTKYLNPFLLSLIIISGVNLFLLGYAFADNNCFIVQENDKIIKQDGNCKNRLSPCSTFKIPIALMGFEEGILKNEDYPSLPYKEKYKLLLNMEPLLIWKQNIDPKKWMKFSVVWYSQMITQKFGIAKFKDYVEKFGYGNQDISGDKEKNNGLTYSWLVSSLKISPFEQMTFLEKLLKFELPISKGSQQLVHNIIFVKDLPNGWRI